MNAKDCPHGNTWVKRQLGAAYDPDRCCPYTGRPLWPFPCVHAGEWLIRYWRQDGHCFRVRRMTPAEIEWTRANWEQVQASQAKLSRWLETFAK